MYKKVLNSNIYIILFVFLLQVNIFAEYETPCFTDCTGDWLEGTKTVYTPGCVTCEITVHYHYRTANCPNNNPTEEYQFHIDYFEGNAVCYMCWDIPDNVAFFQMILNRFLISLAAELQNATVIKVSFASCWSSDLLGPFPKMQPCDNTYCCKDYYNIENGLIQYIGNDDNGDFMGCPTIPGINCEYICDPNGFLYKRDINGNGNEQTLNVLIIPNPNQGNFEILFSDKINNVFFLEVFNINGQSVYHTQIGPNLSSRRIKINLPNLSNGVYQTIITDDRKVILNKRNIIIK